MTLPTRTNLRGMEFFSRSRNALHRRYVLCATAAMTLYSYFLATGKSWDPTFANQVKFGNPFGADFYRNQALAILDGRLDVPIKNYSWNECMMNNGKCFGYFGIFPSFLRFPEFLLTGKSTVNHIPVYVALGIGLCFWASLDLFRRIMADVADEGRLTEAMADRLLILGTLIIGPGSVLAFLSEPAVYEETIIWAIAMSMVVINMVWRWTRDPRHGQLIVATVAGVAAVNSRLSAVPIMVVLGGYLVHRRFRDDSANDDVRGRNLEISLLVVPAVTYSAVMFAKFGQLVPPIKSLSYVNDKTLVDIKNANHGSYTSPRFLLTNLVQYLRPDSISWSSTYPWVRFTVKTTADAFLVPPIVRVGMWTNHVVSATNTMFVQLILSLTFLFSSFREGLKTRVLQLPLVLIVATAAAPVPMLFTFSNTTRYLGDCYPFLIVGSIYGLVSFVRSNSMTAAFKNIMLNVGIVIAVTSSFMWYVLQVNRW